MLVGPHDKRLKRTRCSTCAARHLKCSKTIPCQRCSQDSILCLYPPSKRELISETAWRHNTICTSSSLQRSALYAAGPIKETLFFQQFFEVFLPQNLLTGAAGDWHVYLSANIAQCRGHFAALAALGALVDYKNRHGVSHPVRVLESALQSYQEAVHFLQCQIDKDFAKWDAVSILSVAFLLSMFELLYDSTGVGWNSHMGFGTSVILQACGPSHFRSESALAIYRELRLFEISRAALFSQTSLLADSEWILHDERCRATSGNWSLLEKAFDLFLQCVKLHHRFLASQEVQGGDFAIDEVEQDSPWSLTLIANDSTFRTEGVRLQSQLLTFTSLFQRPIALQEQLPAQIYSYVMLIYLSGIFDNGITTSQSTGAPVLQSQDIAFYCENIVQLCEKALKGGCVSLVLLLVPLRIAGNRCESSTQCRKVFDLLLQIERTFTVAKAFRRELIEIWKSRGLMEAVHLA